MTGPESSLVADNIRDDEHEMPRMRTISASQPRPMAPMKAHWSTTPQPYPYDSGYGRNNKGTFLSICLLGVESTDAEFQRLPRGPVRPTEWTAGLVLLKRNLLDPSGTIEHRARLVQRRVSFPNVYLALDWILPFGCSNRYAPPTNFCPK